MPGRPHFIAGLGVIFAVAAAAGAQSAANFPDQPIRVIVSVPAGGGVASAEEFDGALVALENVQRPTRLIRLLVELDERRQRLRVVRGERDHLLVQRNGLRRSILLRTVPHVIARRGL